MPLSVAAGSPPPAGSSADHSSLPGDDDRSGASPRDLRLRAGLVAERPALPARQRKFKGGTTSFMFVLHVGAVAAL